MASKAPTIRFTRRRSGEAAEGTAGARSALAAVGVQTWVYARHGHELMGCKSPVGGHHDSRITTSRGQGQHREGLSEGSPSAKVRADGQKSHRRLSPGASQHLMTKPAVSRGRVNAAVVHRERMFLFGEICAGWRGECDRAVARRARWRTKAQAQRKVVGRCERIRQRTRSAGPARRAAMRGVIGQKSAEAVLAARAARGAW